MEAFINFIYEVNLIILCSGLYLIYLSIAMTTGNLRSAFLFKAVPAVLGFSLCIIALKEVGIL